MALIPFRRKRRLEIEYVEEFKRFCYVVDFKGRSIENDPIALCYLRVCKEVLLFYTGTGRYERYPARGLKDSQAERLPYAVFVSEPPYPNMTAMLRHIEEIHILAERLFEFSQGPGRALNQAILRYEWSIR